MTTHEKAIEKVNHLIQINYDRKEGYEKAEEKTDDLALKSFFSQNAKQSNRYIVDLGMAVENYGGVPEEKTSTGGDLHRIWMDVKNAFSAHEDKAILDSCEQGERFALEAYRDVLAERETMEGDMIQGDILGVLKLQLNDIENASNRIVTLRSKV